MFYFKILLYLYLSLFQNKSKGIFSFLKSFFDIKHVKDSLKIVYKKGPHNRRLKFILLFCAIILSYGPGYGIIRIIFKYIFQTNCFKSYNRCK